MAKGSSKTYPVNLVGEQHHAANIAGLRVGDDVTIGIERNNPHDARALICLSDDDRPLGYISRDSFVQRAVHDDGDGIAARILQIDRSGPFPQVQLGVRVVDPDDEHNCVEEVLWHSPPAAPMAIKAFDLGAKPVTQAAKGIAAFIIVFLLVKLFS